MTRAELDAAMANPVELAGAAGQQVSTVVTRIEEVAAGHPEAAAYLHGPVL